MERTAHKTKLPNCKSWGEMKKVATEEPHVVGVPEVVGVAVVRVEPQTIVVPLNVEHVQVAIRIGTCALP